MTKEKILIIGAGGQIGTALLTRLQSLYGSDNVIASDLHDRQGDGFIYERLDATNRAEMAAIVKKYRISQIYHLAAILSAKAEADPLWAWNLNMQSLLNVFEVARSCEVSKVFVPSSIAVFGPGAPRDFTPQQAYLDPSTVYGISKVAAENWSAYYFGKYGLDIRSVRYPGVISYQSAPGGGTTDYAVDIYHKAVSGQHYTCYLKENTRLPMIYIDDALRAAVEIMEAEQARIRIRTSYNLAGVSFTPLEIYQQIRTHYPGFTCSFQPDFRQNIADSWPRSIDDSAAAADWGWKAEFDLKNMTDEMFAHLSAVKAG